MSDAVPQHAMTIVLWVLRALMAALFLFAAFAKLTGQPMMVQEFGLLQVGQWFRYVVGLMELAGGVAVLVAAISGLGALLLLVVDVGAFFAQILFMHGDFVHAIVIGAILRRARLPPAGFDSRTAWAVAPARPTALGPVRRALEQTPAPAPDRRPRPSRSGRGRRLRRSFATGRGT